MKKRIISFLLAVLVVCSMAPAVFAASTPTSGKCGVNVTWSFLL